MSGASVEGSLSLRADGRRDVGARLRAVSAHPRVAGSAAAYVSGEGHAFIGRRLYPPKGSTGAPDRSAAARAPDDVAFATEPRLPPPEPRRPPRALAAR